MADFTSFGASTPPKRPAPGGTEPPPSKRLPLQEHNSAAFAQAELIAMQVANRVLIERVEQLHQDNTALTVKQEQLATDSYDERVMWQLKFQEAEKLIARLQVVLKEKEVLSKHERDEMQRLRDHSADMAQHELTLFRRIQSLRAELDATKSAKSTIGQVDIKEVDGEAWTQMQVNRDLVQLEKLRDQRQTFEKEKRDMQHKIFELEASLTIKEDQSIKAVREEMERLQVGSAQHTEDLKAEIKIIRKYNADLEHDRSTLEQKLQAAQQEVQNAQDKISGLEEDLEEQKQLCGAVIKAKEKLARQQQAPQGDPRGKDKLQRTIQILADERDGLAKKVKDMSTGSSSAATWQDAAKANKAAAKKSNEKTRKALETQRDLEVQLQQRDAEIAELKRNPPKKSSKKAVKEAEKQTNAAINAQMAAEGRLESFFQHYDTLHGKNLVLVSKLTAMAQVGGFGNHGSIYRKELEALKGMPLEDLDEYKEQS
ncbi:hypothetical protein E8E12_009937 [Didymella heteroderae]|uniref:Uncharacterized protein n=1 Tax=Didymella heteroderae TaxID=1769908 RepID=A0A9P5C3H2_9PLEO|nr:hypothetical protein E8E12_009937 [Didymella heteroderae]